MLENRALPNGSAYLAEPYSPTSVHRQIVGIFILVAMQTTGNAKGFYALNLIFFYEIKSMENYIIIKRKEQEIILIIGYKDFFILFFFKKY